MKIGIYLGYKPFSPGASLKKEGLGRYLATLIENLLKKDNKIVVACPKWVEGLLQELFDEYNMNINDIELISTISNPIVVQLYYKMALRKGRKKSIIRAKLSNAIDALFEFAFSILLSIENKTITTIMAIFFFAVFVLMLPFMLLFVAVACIIKVVLLVLKKTLGINVINRDTLKSIIVKIASLPILSSFKWRFIKEIRSKDVLEKLRINAAKKLISKISKLKEPADVWYAPMAFWPEFNDIRGVTVTCIPDIVMDEFPIHFSSLSSSATMASILAESVENGKYFITYCNYIKESILINKYGIEAEKIKPIMMFVNETNNDINVKNSFKYHENANSLFSKLVLSALSLKSVNKLNPQYFYGEKFFPFNDIKYIFYSSQVRFHKNILSLVKAYEYLLKSEKITCKLFLTGNYNENTELSNYIESHGLQDDVLCFCNVDNQMLAALYACAELSVNPTLYEGGFPFTFSEGMSVGTPSIMSDIPQVREFVENWNIDDCIFDPYDYKDIADKIVYGLNNRQKLYQKQKPLYEMHSERTSSGRAGEEYIEAFKYFIELDKKEKLTLDI
nr:glycosyltransferase [uncultured Aminipila sp.]